jgi:uncharacterized tellurite resistance protein B-like protein
MKETNENETESFDKLLIKTAFCCMASDGHIDDREIEIIRGICVKSPLFKDYNFMDEINKFIDEINTDGRKFITDYFHLLKNADISEEQEIELIDFAVKIIRADDKVEYSEIKFFKNIRHRLKVQDETLIRKFSDIELFLEEDMITHSSLEDITKQYLDSIELQGFQLTISDDKHR